MSTMPKRRLLTEAEYLLIERQASQKSEYCRGEVFAMAGASDDHEAIAGNCFGLLWNEVRERGCRVYKGDMKVQISKASRFSYPDIAVACGERRFADGRKDILLNPTLIIEVLSDTTAAYDRGEKAGDYHLLESLRELLLVWQDRPRIDVYVRQDKNRWTFTTVEGLDATIVLPSVGYQLRLADVFAGVELPAASRLALRVTEEESR